MSELYSEYSTKLKSFSYLSFLIIVLSGAYLVSGLIAGDKQSLSESVSGGLLGLFAGGFLYHFSRKKRTLKLYPDKIEYLKPQPEFTANWDDIILVKSFQEMNRRTENLVIMTKDEQVLSISTAFFDREKLINAFRDIQIILSERSGITFEDDRKWGN
ncbi:MAG: hypothetical protein KIT33_12665 [Candidatus Kapabacteria bacterium]|nr:hypothetical protein [Ignavibacteriota bacterium]MCW5885813.1 hypothetical protein [Candidatus Kapabacteria bacterium]